MQSVLSRRLSILETREITRHVSLCTIFKNCRLHHLPLASLGGRVGTHSPGAAGDMGLPPSNAPAVAHSAHPTLPIYVASAYRYPSDSMTSSAVPSLAPPLSWPSETQCYQMLPASAPIVGWGSGSIPLPPLRLGFRADPSSGCIVAPLQRGFPHAFHSVSRDASPTFQSRG